MLDETATRFRALAAAAAKAFGYRRYQIEELTLNQAPQPRSVMRSMDLREASAVAAVPVPAEGGEAEVVVTISGRIKMD